MNKQFEGKAALVTGGSSGIGRAAALLFAQEGAKVVVVARRVPESEETVNMIKEAGGEAIFVKCDVTNNSQVQDMVNAVLRKFGRIDILVNNAGALGTLWSLEEVTEEDWDRILNLNMKSVFLCCMAVVPYMKEIN